MTKRYEANRRWRLAHPERRNKQRRTYYAQFTDLAVRGRYPWTSAEIERIIAPDRPPDRELAAELGRTVRAVQSARGKALHD